MGWPKRLLVLGIVVGVLVGIGYGGYVLLFAKSDPVASDKPAVTVSDLDEVCHSREPKYFPETARYTGDGPQPAVIFEAWNGFNALMVNVPVPDGGKPSKVWNPDVKKPQDIQLVACLSEPDEGEQVGQCSFTSPDPASYDLYRGIYDVTLYEARTGKQVAEVEGIRGRDEGGCPPLDYLRDGEDPEYRTPIDTEELRSAFAKYVDE